MFDEASILVTIAILHIKGRLLRHWFYRLLGTTLVHHLHGPRASSVGERTYQCLCAPLERSTTSALDELLARERMGHAIAVQLRRSSGLKRRIARRPCQGRGKMVVHTDLRWKLQSLFSHPSTCWCANRDEAAVTSYNIPLTQDGGVHLLFVLTLHRFA